MAPATLYHNPFTPSLPMMLPSKPPSFLRRRSYTINGHTFHTVPVEKGSFVMGDDESEYGDEKPAHTVT
ncbi:MAG: hypothetical protein ACOYOO_15920, partial [Saprospiraceae bacterium]